MSDSRTDLSVLINITEVKFPDEVQSGIDISIHSGKPQKKHSNFLVDDKAWQNFYRHISRISSVVKYEAQQISRISEFAQQFNAVTDELSEDAKLFNSKMLTPSETLVLRKAKNLRRRFWKVLNKTSVCYLLCTYKFMLVVYLETYLSDGCFHFCTLLIGYDMR